MTMTINYAGIEFEVEFDYQPEERMTLEYPGCPQEATLNEITHKGEDFYSLLEGHHSKIESAILEQMTDPRDY